MSLIIPANSLAGGYAVDNSLRFNSGSSDYLEKALTGVDGNRQIWTFSSWVKRAKLGTAQTIFSFGDNLSSEGKLEFDANDFLVLVSDFQNGGSNETDMKFRDVGAWYHIVWACDSTQATNADRWKFYVNGTQVTLTGSPAITLNGNGIINAWAAHDCWLGANARSQQSGNPTNYSDVYLSETHFIDGQQLTPTDFGEFDADSGVWKPIAYSGTYGTNGFFLEFQDSGALGTDSSGEGNNFTVNNLTSIDQTTDTPTNNFTLLNTLNYSSSTRTYGEGNTAITASGSGDWNTALNNIGVRSGKWYAEFKINSVGSFSAIGVTLWPVLSPVNPSATLNFTFLVGEDAGAYGWRNNGARPQGGSSLSSWGTNDILMIAMDMDNLKVYFGKNGTWETSGDPESGATGTGSIGDLTADQDYFFVICPRGGSTYCNFGNPAFTIASGNTDGNDYGNFEYAVPSGYLALCTSNLSEVNS
jgi:hypothetical protein